jgi:ribosomal protein S13
LIYEKEAEFKYVLRILNTNIEGKRKIAYAIRSIKGIGRRFAILICKLAKIDLNKRYNSTALNPISEILTLYFQSCYAVD